MEAWRGEVSLGGEGGRGGPYESRVENVGEAGGHVDVLAADEVGAEDGHLVLLALALSSVLLVDDPDSCAGVGARLGGLLGHDELEPGHGLEPAFEELPRGEVLRHVGVVETLLEEDFIVRRLVVEGGEGEVVEDAVVVDAAFEGGGRSPLDLVEGGTGRGAGFRHGWKVCLFTVDEGQLGWLRVCPGQFQVPGRRVGGGVWWEIWKSFVSSVQCSVFGLTFGPPRTFVSARVRCVSPSGPLLHPGCSRGTVHRQRGHSFIICSRPRRPRQPRHLKRKKHHVPRPARPVSNIGTLKYDRETPHPTKLLDTVVMDLLSTVRKTGSRGGVNFSWDDVATSQHRENYLGHSVKAPVGRWAKGKDLTWYARAEPSAANAGETEEQREERERREEIQNVKEAEEEAIARALGLPIAPKNVTGANSIQVEGDKVPSRAPADEAPVAPKESRKERHHDSDRRHKRRHRSREGDEGRDRDRDHRHHRRHGRDRSRSRERKPDGQGAGERHRHSRRRSASPGREAHRAERRRDGHRSRSRERGERGDHRRRSRSRSRSRSRDRKPRHEGGRRHGRSRSRSRQRETRRDDQR